MHFFNPQPNIGVSLQSDAVCDIFYIRKNLGMCRFGIYEFKF